MKKKIILFLVAIILIIVSFSFGKEITKMRYHMPLANCVSSDIPYDEYEALEISYPFNVMIQNYYTDRLIFTEMYVPKNITLKDYYPNFNNGGFHYFKTESNQIVACGLYK